MFKPYYCSTGLDRTRTHRKSILQAVTLYLVRYVLFKITTLTEELTDVVYIMFGTRTQGIPKKSCTTYVLRSSHLRLLYYHS